MFWNIVLISTLVTFSTILVFQKKYAYVIVKVGKYHIHHSFHALVIILAGRIFTDNFHNIITAFGLGMYFSHVIEELVFEKNRLFKAFFTFITPLDPRRQIFKK